MDDFDDTDHQERLSRLAVDGSRPATINRKYSSFVKSLRLILPIIALVMTVVVLTWDEAGSRFDPVKKEEVIETSNTVQNELLKPVFNSIDSKNQPYTVTADKATQNRGNPDLTDLLKPVASFLMNTGEKIDGHAEHGIYQQKAEKLNLDGDVHLIHSNGYTLVTEELRVDLATGKAYSGRDVRVEGPGGTIDATGLEGDSNTGALIFTGPATVVLYSGGSLLSSEDKTP